MIRIHQEEKIMKKTMLTIVLMTAALSMAGCGSDSGAAAATAAGTTAVKTTVAESTGEEKSSQAAETTAEASESATEAEASGFTFAVGDTVIAMNADVAPILEKLGEWENYSETTSCAFKGLDKTYSYPGFDLYTYPLYDKDHVNSVYFVDDTVSTPEGIHIGSTKEEMEAAYGTDYEEEFGAYTYTKDKSKLQFLVTDGVIDSVEYTAITPES